MMWVQNSNLSVVISLNGGKYIFGRGILPDTVLFEIVLFYSFKVFGISIM